MGTRADFYVGRGKKAEWIGSIACDGYPDGLRDTAIFTSTSEPGFREAVAEELAKRDDGTIPEQGWPWPWDDSHTTDYSYAFDDGIVYATNWGYRWFKADGPEPEEEHDDKQAVFPKMRTEGHAPAGSKRSGVMLFSFKRE